ncbi:unnamed protein product [Cunninghamella echinulata]
MDLNSIYLILIKKVKLCDDYVCGLCPNDLFLNTSASLGRCPKLHSEEAREMINETISNTPEYSVLPKHLKNLEDILQERDHKVSQANCWKNNMYTSSEKVDDLMNEIEQLNQKILEKQTGFDDLHDDDIRNLNQLLLEQDLKYDKLNEILTSNIDEVKLNVCNICSQYLPIDKSESSISLHNENSVGT